MSINGINVAKKGEQETEEQRELQLGNSLNNFKQSAIWKNYQKGKDVVDRTIATEAQVEKIRNFGIKIGEEITGQSIGQASYTATAQECDEAQANLDRLIQEEQTKEGGQEQND